MTINATIGNKIAKVFPKIVGKQIEGGSKVTGKFGISVFAPENAQTYDILPGICKKGKFRTYFFRNENGDVIQQYTRYLQRNNRYTDVIIDTDKSTGIINRVKKIITGSLHGKGNIEQIEHSSMLPFISPANGKMAFQKSFMTMSPIGDFGGQEILQQGKKAAGFKYKYNWNGKPSNIEYKNTLGQKLDITETEAQYLPFVNRRFCLVEQNGQQVLGNVDFTTDRIAEEVKLSQIIQERLHGIEGIPPKAKTSTVQDICRISDHGKSYEEFYKDHGFTPTNVHLPNGQIYFATDVPDNRDGLLILRNMAHEMQHEKDNIMQIRGGQKALSKALEELGMTEKQHAEKIKDRVKFVGEEEYKEKVIAQLGDAKEGTKDYIEAINLNKMDIKRCSLKDLKTWEQHEADEFEGRANLRAQQQMDLYTHIVTKVSNFLSQLIG